MLVGCCRIFLCGFLSSRFHHSQCSSLPSQSTFFDHGQPLLSPFILQCALLLVFRQRLPALWFQSLESAWLSNGHSFWCLLCHAFFVFTCGGFWTFFEAFWIFFGTGNRFVPKLQRLIVSLLAQKWGPKIEGKHCFERHCVLLVSRSRKGLGSSPARFLSGSALILLTLSFVLVLAGRAGCFRYQVSTTVSTVATVASVKDRTPALKPAIL